MRYVDRPMFQSLLQKSIVTLGPTTLSAQFNEYITNHFTWDGSGIAWWKVPGAIEVDLQGFEEGRAKAFLDRTTLSKYETIAVVYAAREPCFWITYNNLTRYCYELISVELCFFVGMLDHKPESMSHDLVEYRHRNGFRLSGIAREPSELGLSENPAERSN